MRFNEELSSNKEMKMEYLIVYYACPEGPDGREPAEEYRRSIECENDDAARKEALRYPKARLYKLVPLP